MDRDTIREKSLHNLRRLRTSVKWILFSLLSGVVIGAISSCFGLWLKDVTGFRQAHPRLVFLLPAAGLLIVFLYRVLKDENDSGTNLVLRTIQSGDHVRLRTVPAIFLSTLLTHLFGGSAGREGAAIQLGGSLGGTIGKWFRFDEKDQHVMIMCGMSAAFSALFGTPLAAAFFSMEVVSVGIMHYSALVPCVIASFVAKAVANRYGLAPDCFDVSGIPAFSLKTALIAALLAVLCALVSVLFCIALHRSEWALGRLFPNPYLRIFVGGAVVAGLTLLVGDMTYNGAGVDVIERCFTGSIPLYAFLLKILFTAVTIGSGYKGGEIVPTFFIGASFGFLFSTLTGFDRGLSAAIGMIAVFCGVTNCPITSLLISFELFGYAGMPYYILAVALSYTLSGYYGLYSAQRIVYSKFKTNFINKNSH